jgi:hypothetical protein
MYCRTTNISGLSVTRLKEFDCNCFLLQQHYYKKNRYIPNSAQKYSFLIKMSTTLLHPSWW